MTNREKYAEEILDIACTGSSFAIIKGNKIVRCSGTRCEDCIFCTRVGKCEEKLKEWANSEYIEKPKISKRDRVFLEYIKAPCKYIARDMKGDIYAYKDKPTKTEDIWIVGGMPLYTGWLNLDFPMIKWEDKEPWLIEDLKKLEVVEEYESN